MKIAEPDGTQRLGRLTNSGNSVFAEYGKRWRGNFTECHQARARWLNDVIGDMLRDGLGHLAPACIADTEK